MNRACGSWRITNIFYTSAWIAGGCSIALAVFTTFIAAIFRNRRQWQYLTIMSLLEAYYCIVLPYYFSERSEIYSMLLIGSISGTLCYMTVFTGQLTIILLEKRYTWLSIFQKLNIFLTTVFSFSIAIDLSSGSHLILSKVVFNDTTSHLKLLQFSSFGYGYLVFVSIAFTLFTLLLLWKQSNTGARFQPINMGLCIYFVCVISDFNILYGVYDFYYLQHFGYLGLVAGFILYFAKDYYETIQKYGEAKETVAAQKEALLEAEHLKTLGMVSSYIGHEIKNPLGTVMGSHFILSRHFTRIQDDSKFVQAQLEKIDRAAKMIHKIIDGIFSFIQNNGRNNHEPSSIKCILDNAKLFTEEKARLMRIRLDFKFPKDDFMLRCNPTQITQVIINLVSNACDALESFDNPWIEVSVTNKDDFFGVYIVDSGGGIPQELKNNITNPFFTTKQANNGSGLGLSIVQEIAKLHNGSLEIGTKNGHTCFSFLIPLTN